METIYLSSKKFLAGCAVVAAAILFVGASHPFSPMVIGAEVLLTIVSLFVFGSMKYQIDKNALTYGAVLIIAATFFTGWWPTSGLRAEFEADGVAALVHFGRHTFFTLHGLNDLVHADTMLFILGLTFFVATIAQTRLLETVSFAILKKNGGNVLPTMALLIAIVAFSSGILDGVSMIGLMIRTMVIILFLAKSSDEAVKFAVVVSTVVTTVCGMWLAYGEPPNLIMKANLDPHLTNSFFLRYCLPMAVGSYFIVLWNVRRALKGRKIDIKRLDVLDLHTADVRFLQAEKHGEVLIPVEFMESQTALLGEHAKAVEHRLHKGTPLGEALVLEGVPQSVRLQVLEVFTTRHLAEALDAHYEEKVKTGKDLDERNFRRIEAALAREQKKRRKLQKIGILSFVPFVGFLILHAIHHEVPLFWASFAGFAVAFTGVFSYPKIRRLVIHEASHEYREYLFLFPLFLSITLLQKSGFFSALITLVNNGIEHLGVAVMAYLQYSGAVFLSALLDNNVVADFASRALHGLDLGTLHIFAMSQIAGYAVGGCWTHIGSAQSVVAFSFIKKEVDSKYSPFAWIRMMTPVIIQMSIWILVVIVAEHFLF